MFDDVTLLALAAVMTGLMLVQFVGRPGRPRRAEAADERAGWIAAAIIVLGAIALLYAAAIPGGGLIAIALVLLLLFAPIMAARAMETAMRAGRFGRGLVAAIVLVALHPSRFAWRAATLLAALSRAARGAVAPATRTLERLVATGRPTDATALLARIHLGRLHDDWWAVAALPARPANGGARLRALAELGDLDGAVDAYADAAQAALTAPALAALRLALLAFAGRPEGVAHILAGPLAEITDESAALWLATARLCAGDPSAHAALRALATGGRSCDTRTAAARRLAWTPPAPVRDAYRLAVIDTADAAARAYPPAVGRHAIVTWTLIAANTLMYLRELHGGDPTDSDLLYNQGALWPHAVFAQGEWWRLLTALFLHAGIVHIGFNMIALLVFGPPVERRLGHAAFAFLYLGAGLASMVSVALLMQYGIETPDLLVGASGAILGLVGGALGLSLRRFGADAATARGERRALLSLLVLQTALDLSVPHISLSGHLSGAAAGFAIGMALPLRRTTPRLRRLLGARG